MIKKADRDAYRQIDEIIDLFFKKSNFKPQDLAYIFGLGGKDAEDLINLIFYLLRKPRTVKNIAADFKVDRTTVYNWLDNLLAVTSQTSLMTKQKPDTKEYFVDQDVFFKMIKLGIARLSRTYDEFQKVGEKKIKDVIESHKIKDIQILREERAYDVLRRQFFDPKEHVKEIWTFLPDSVDGIRNLYEKDFILVENIQKLSEKAPIVFLASDEINGIIKEYLKDCPNIYYYSYTKESASKFMPISVVVSVKKVEEEDQTRYHAVISNMLADDKISLYDTTGSMAEDILRSKKGHLVFGLTAKTINPFDSNTTRRGPIKAG